MSRLNSLQTRRAQRGAVVVLIMAFAVVAVAALAALDVGKSFMLRRDAQRWADMAALAGVAGAGDCTVMQSLARQSLGLNAYPGDPNAASLTCGRVDRTQTPSFVPTPINPSALQATVPVPTQPLILKGLEALSATAVASSNTDDSLVAMGIGFDVGLITRLDLSANAIKTQIFGPNLGYLNNTETIALKTLLADATVLASVKNRTPMPLSAFMIALGFVPSGPQVDGKHFIAADILRIDKALPEIKTLKVPKAALLYAAFLAANQGNSYTQQNPVTLSGSNYNVPVTIKLGAPPALAVSKWHATNVNLRDVQLAQGPSFLLQFNYRRDNACNASYTIPITMEVSGAQVSGFDPLMCAADPNKATVGVSAKTYLLQTCLSGAACSSLAAGYQFSTTNVVGAYTYTLRANQSFRQFGGVSFGHVFNETSSPKVQSGQAFIKDSSASSQELTQLTQASNFTESRVCTNPGWLGANCVLSSVVNVVCQVLNFVLQLVQFILELLFGANASNTSQIGFSFDNVKLWQHDLQCSGVPTLTQ